MIISVKYTMGLFELHCVQQYFNFCVFSTAFQFSLDGIFAGLL